MKSKRNAFYVSTILLALLVKTNMAEAAEKKTPMMECLSQKTVGIDSKKTLDYDFSKGHYTESFPIGYWKLKIFADLESGAEIVLYKGMNSVQTTNFSMNGANIPEDGDINKISLRDSRVIKSDPFEEDFVYPDLHSFQMVRVDGTKAFFTHMFLVKWTESGVPITANRTFKFDCQATEAKADGPSFLFGSWKGIGIKNGVERHTSECVAPMLSGEIILFDVSHLEKISQKKFSDFVLLHQTENPLQFDMNLYQEDGTRINGNVVVNPKNKSAQIQLKLPLSNSTKLVKIDIQIENSNWTELGYFSIDEGKNWTQYYKLNMKKSLRACTVAQSKIQNSKLN